MKPKYQVIADSLRDKIISTEYAVGGVIPTELQLQEAYHASRYTVRQAVSVLVSEGYLRKEKGSGTYVNEPPTSTIETSPKKTIGVITTYISDYIFPTIIRGIEKELKADGYSLLLSSTNNDYLQEKECLDRMIEFGVDGLIVEPTKSNQYNPNLATYVTLREHNIPIVMINATYEELSTPSIHVDDVETGYLATKELIDNNHQRLLLITKIDDLQGKYRMKGFIKACEEKEIKLSSNSIITYTTETEVSIYDKIISHLKEFTDISGIVCYNDKIAKTLIGKLSSLGYKIPDDFSIVGNDDSTLSQMGEVSLTTTVHPKEKMGIDAAKWIVNTIKNGKFEKDILYPPKLIRRNSVKKLKTED
ncbi:Transcriptional repressor of arabinoside utilization operon GntR family [Lactococcus lactis subsp. lactis]|uniref:GntR family transcriptional regulator n=1 Tax=Lactococcus lactis TaxID=1358 RepID=UPI00071C31C2|nr:GntR family transcriptional regulator [Lactococcus lactis]KSU11853.1 Transcriptional repressor of arabinoside utilization operon GntR family [Lactococcus lactis subsp. lactis]